MPSFPLVGRTRHARLTEADPAVTLAVILQASTTILAIFLRSARLPLPRRSGLTSYEHVLVILLEPSYSEFRVP